MVAWEAGMAVDVIGWETLLDRLRSSDLSEAAYLTLNERRGNAESQMQRFDLTSPSGPDDAFTFPLVDQVMEQVDELRALAIDDTPMGDPMHYRISVYGPKGHRILSVSFTTHRPNPNVPADGASVNSATAVAGVNAYLVASFELGQRANRDSVQQLRENNRLLQARVRELEERYLDLINRIADVRKADAENAGAAERVREGRAMFENFMGSVRELGTAYLLREAPELAGLDSALLVTLKGVLDDPEVAKSIKDPALQEQLKDPAFRKDFASVLDTMAEAARQHAQAKATTPTPAA